MPRAPSRHRKHTVNIFCDGKGEYDCVAVEINTRDTEEDLYLRIRGATNISRFHLVTAEGNVLPITWQALASRRNMKIYLKEGDARTSCAMSRGPRKDAELTAEHLQIVMENWGVRNESDILPGRMRPRLPTTLGPSTDQNNFNFLAPSDWPVRFSWVLQRLSIQMKRDEAIDLLEQVMEERKNDRNNCERFVVETIMQDLYKAYEMKTGVKGKTLKQKREKELSKRVKERAFVDEQRLDGVRNRVVGKSGVETLKEGRKQNGSSKAEEKPLGDLQDLGETLTSVEGELEEKMEEVPEEASMQEQY